MFYLVFLTKKMRVNRLTFTQSLHLYVGEEAGVPIVNNYAGSYFSNSMS